MLVLVSVYNLDVAQRKTCASNIRSLGEEVVSLSIYRDERLKRKQLTFSSYAERWVGVWLMLVCCVSEMLWITGILYVCIMFAITSTAKLSRDKTFAVF